MEEGCLVHSCRAATLCLYRAAVGSMRVLLALNGSACVGGQRWCPCDAGLTTCDKPPYLVPWNSTNTRCVTRKNRPLPSGVVGNRWGRGVCSPAGLRISACRSCGWRAIAGTVARLATGSGELTLGRAGCAPAGRQTTFPEGLVSARPFDQPCLVARHCLYSSREGLQPRQSFGLAPAREQVCSPQPIASAQETANGRDTHFRTLCRDSL